MTVFAALRTRETSMHDPRRPLRLIMMLACSMFGFVHLGQARAAQAFELPPISEDARVEHHPGKIIWADLVTPDLAAAERFYGGLFGWKFQTIRAGGTDYALVMIDGRPIAGLVQRSIPVGEKRHSAWLTFIAVPDIEAARRIALANGAKSVSPPKNYPRRGGQAVITDPEGAVFAALASSSGDSVDYVAAPGEWIWSSLLTRDPARSAAFYKAVFGYELFDLPNDDDAQHVILATEDYARAGIHSLPPGHWHPHWLNFVRVNDATQASARAAALGGRTLVEPYLDRHGGKVAIIADPLGAPVGLMEWTDTDSKLEPQ